MRYGRCKDGSMSPCRAKDPAHCPYHTDHVDMTPQEADAINEAVKASSNAPRSLSKGEGSDIHKQVDELISYEDASERYDKAIELIQKIEAGNREDYSQQIKAPSLKGNSTSETDENELKWMASSGVESKLHAGQTLLPDEEKTMMSNLNESIAADPSRKDVSPLQEYSLRMLTMNPAQSKDTLDKLVSNDWVANNASKYIIGSPHCTRSQEDTLYKKNPTTALESQRLSASHVNDSLNVRPTSRNYAELCNALRHPNADPKLAYKKMREAQSSSNLTSAQKQNLEFQMSNNPNPEFHKKVAELDANNPRIRQLLMTREYNDWHSESGHSEEISKI